MYPTSMINRVRSTCHAFSLEANKKLDVLVKKIKDFINDNTALFILAACSGVTFYCSPVAFLAGVAGGFGVGLLQEDEKTQNSRFKVTSLMVSGSLIGAMYAPLNLIVQRAAVLLAFPCIGGIPAGVALHSLYRTYRPYVDSEKPL